MKLLPSSHFVRTESSLGQLLFWKATFLVEYLLRIKISTEELLWLMQVLLHSINFFRRAAFSKKLFFQKRNILHYLLFQESYLFAAATFSKDVTFFTRNLFSRHFRPKLVYWNESVYCTPIDRALKMWFNKGSGSFLRPTIPELWRFLRNQLRRFLDKINTQI